MHLVGYTVYLKVDSCPTINNQVLTYQNIILKKYFKVILERQKLFYEILVQFILNSLRMLFKNVLNFVTLS